MNPALAHAVAGAVGEEIVRTEPVGGGCINDAYECQLAGGRRVFVKGNPAADPQMFPAEARGLRYLAEADALRVPRVVAASTASDPVGFLVLEFLAPARRSDSRAYDDALGRGLAALHRYGADAFGLDHPNFLATLPQDNTPMGDWPTFYAQRRLEPQVKRAVHSGVAPRSWLASFEQLYARMAEIAGPAEPPARLHGDLWSGNLHCDEHGAPVLIDPAVYGGHREIDLAMLQLFGSPSPRFFAAYDESYPRAPGHRERVPLYQLYPLLAHVNLFGGSYVGQVEAALRRYA